MSRSTTSEPITIAEREEHIVLARLDAASSDWAMTGRAIAASLSLQLGHTYNDKNVRQIVRRLRLQGTPIISTSKGYYLATSPDELMSQARRLQARAKAILQVSKSARQAAATMAAYPINGGCR